MAKVNIPLIDLGKEYVFLKKSIDRQIKNCLKSQSWILGPKVKDFEQKAARYLGVRYAFGVASGTDALVIALRALAYKKNRAFYFGRKDEIITTPFTFIATAEAIARSGARVVFADIDKDNFNISSGSIEKAITKNTVGILPVHLFGLPCRMKEILKIGSKNRLFVVEDCAQSFGASISFKKCGSFSDCAAFSFFPSKNLGAYGDGGMVTTSDKALACYIEYLRNHGQISQYDAVLPGYNSRLDSLQAAVLSAKLDYVDEFNQRRRAIAGIYSQYLGRLPQVSVPFQPRGLNHVYGCYTIKVKEKRDQLLSFLNSKGISARVYYPKSLNRMDVFKQAKGLRSCPKALELTRQVLSLPIHPFISEKEAIYVCRAVEEFFAIS